MGGRVGERAKQPKVPAMRSIVGKAAEGGAALKFALPRIFKQACAGPRRMLCEAA
jgi:hypothetical protein